MLRNFLLFRSARLSLSLRHQAKYSTRMASSSSSLLISDPAYAWLKTELGLQEVNAGVFDGSWHAQGKVCPTPLYTAAVYCTLRCR